MINRYRKLRMSYDELAYILSLMEVDRYLFFEKQNRSIDMEQAVSIINDMIRKRWLVPGKEKYTLSKELGQYVEHIKRNNSVFAVRAEYNRCHDLLCYSRSDSVLTVERDYNRKGYVLLCLNDADSFLEMLEDEGYLRTIVPVDEEDFSDAEKDLRKREDILNSTDGLREGSADAMLSFEKISENGNRASGKPLRALEDPFADEAASEEILSDSSRSEIKICKNGLYPYISVNNGTYYFRIPYNIKNLKDVLIVWMMEKE